MTQWFTDVVECADSSCYVGITDDLLRRIAKHNRGEGARWTAKRGPVVLRYAVLYPDKGSARRREMEIKGWRHEKNRLLFDSPRNTLANIPD